MWSCTVDGAYVKEYSIHVVTGIGGEASVRFTCTSPERSAAKSVPKADIALQSGWATVVEVLLVEPKHDGAVAVYTNRVEDATRLRLSAFIPTRTFVVSCRCRWAKIKSGGTFLPLSLVPELTAACVSVSWNVTDLLPETLSVSAGATILHRLQPGARTGQCVVPKSLPNLRGDMLCLRREDTQGRVSSGSLRRFLSTNVRITWVVVIGIFVIMRIVPLLYRTWLRLA